MPDIPDGKLRGNGIGTSLLELELEGVACYGMTWHTEPHTLYVTTVHVVTMEDRREDHGSSCHGRQSFPGLPGPGRPHARQLNEQGGGAF